MNQEAEAGALISARPTLILLAGLLCDEEIWSEVARPLSLIAELKLLSFPGFSSIEEMAEHVLSVAPGRFALAGHSMGGRVALEVMRRAPTRVTGLALLNTGVHGATAEEPANRGRLVNLARTEGMRALAVEWLPPMLGGKKRPEDTLVARLNQMIERNTPESFSNQIHALLNRPDAKSVLPTVQVPTLLLSASEDTWSPPDQHAAMRALCPGAQLVIVQGAGHMSTVEQPVAVASALKQWLMRIADSSTADTLTLLEKLLIRDTCTRQIHRFARLNDGGAWEGLSALFTESGILCRPSDPDVPIEGRAQILESCKARPARLNRHSVVNVEVTVESPSRAHAVSAVVLYVSTEKDGTALIASTSVGHFHDQFLKVGDDWLFAERRGAITMRSA